MESTAVIQMVGMEIFFEMMKTFDKIYIWIGQLIGPAYTWCYPLPEVGNSWSILLVQAILLDLEQEKGTLLYMPRDK